MCGICGVVQIDGAPRQVVAPFVLDRMTDAMVHRGPNDRGTHEAPGIALGVRRLSIVDVEGGHQPFENEDGTIVAVQNGELYNHDAIRDELRADGHSFRSRCDTEILPHLYERRGVRLAEYLRGKFGLAVWDGRNQRAVVARDRLGIKPMYYAVVGDLVIFASELKSLLASGLVGTGLDLEAIDAFLTLGYFPAPLTPLAEVRKLPPGHALVADRDGVRTIEYWEYPKPYESNFKGSTDELAAAFLERLEESVKLRLMSDVPLGAMLSGGLDSSLVVALMARNMSQPVKTFSVGFAEDAQFNELADARYVADLVGADHHEIELSFQDAAVDLGELLWHLDEPLADLSALGFLALSELAAKHVTVALSGQGADELFGGYRKHRAAAIVGAWGHIPSPLRRAGSALLAAGPERFARSAQTLAARDPATRQLAMSGQFDAVERARLLTGELAKLDGSAARKAVLACLRDVDADPLATTLYLDAQLALVDGLLHYFDRASMAHSLEVRVPFLDHEVVEFCAGIPSRLKVRRLEAKHLLKRAAVGLVPDRIIHKQKIGLFRGSTEAWFRAQMAGPLGDHLVGPSPRYAEFVDPAEVRRLVDLHVRGDTSHSQLLLSILMLESWLATFVPRALGAAGAARPSVRVA
jgi:asparagine synthase (glutamine-hydrolysing)